MNKGRVSSGQLVAMAASVSYLSFFVSFQGAHGVFEIAAMCAAESLGIILASEYLDDFLKTAAIRYVIAAYLMFIGIAAVCSFSIVVKSSINTDLLYLLGVLAVLVAVRAGAFGCEAVGRFSSIILVLLAGVSVLLSALSYKLIDVNNLRAVFLIPFSKEMLNWLVLPATGIVLAVFRSNLTENSSLPVGSTVLAICAGKIMLALLLQGVEGALLIRGSRGFLHLVSFSAGSLSPMMLALFSSLLIGLSISSLSAVILASSVIAGGNRGRNVLLFAIPAAAAALIGGVV